MARSAGSTAAVPSSLLLLLLLLLLHCIIVCATAKLHILIVFQWAGHLVTVAGLAAALAVALLFLWRFQLCSFNLSPCSCPTCIDMVRRRRRRLLATITAVGFTAAVAAAAVCLWRLTLRCPLSSSSSCVACACSLEQQGAAGFQQYKCRNHCANYFDCLRRLFGVTGPGQGDGSRCRIRLHRLGSLACAKWANTEEKLMQTWHKWVTICWTLTSTRHTHTHKHIDQAS